MEINQKILEKFLKGNAYIICNMETEIHTIIDYIDKYKLASNKFFMKVEENSLGQFYMLPYNAKPSVHIAYSDLYISIIGTKEYSVSEIIYIIENEMLDDTDIITDKTNKYYHCIDLKKLDMEFLIKSAPYKINSFKYVSFNEAVKSGRRIKYRNWDKYMLPTETIIFGLNNIHYTFFQDMLKEKAWLIEEE